MSKTSKISYTKEFLLSLSELEGCKKPPNGFDESILSEFDNNCHGTQDFRHDHGSYPPTRRDVCSCSWGIHRWDNRSRGRIDADSPSYSNSDTCGRRNAIHSRHSWQNPEQDGLLGIASFPRASGHGAGASVSRSSAIDRYLHNRSNEPYHPLLPYKAMPHSWRNINESYDDETFGKYSWQDRVEEERKRRAEFESMRKEQHKALQQKLRLNSDMPKEHPLSDITALLENPRENKIPDEVNENVIKPASQNDSGKFSDSLQVWSSALVPAGFANCIPEMNSGAKSLIHPDIGEGGRSELEDGHQDENKLAQKIGLWKQKSNTTIQSSEKGLKNSDLSSTIKACMDNNVGYQSLNEILRIREIRRLDTDKICGCKIVAQSSQSTSLLEKIFESALKGKHGGTDNFIQDQDTKTQIVWTPHSFPSSKLAQGLIEECNQPLEDNSSKNSNHLLSLIDSGKNGGSASDTNATDSNPETVASNLTSAVVRINEQLNTNNLEAVPAFLTCEELERSIFSEISEYYSTSQPPRQGYYASNVETEHDNVNNFASQHLLSLLQKGKGYKESPKDEPRDLEIGYIDAIHGNDTDENAVNFYDLQKNSTLETPFGTQFMEELQSVCGPISAQTNSFELANSQTSGPVCYASNVDKEQAKDDVDNFASQYLLSLLQKGMGSQNEAPTFIFYNESHDDQHDIEAAYIGEIHGDMKDEDAEKFDHLGKNLSHEMLNGTVFTNKLQSVGALVSDDGFYHSSVNGIGAKRASHDTILASNDIQQINSNEPVANWLASYNDRAEMELSRLPPAIEVRHPEGDGLITGGNHVNAQSSLFISDLDATNIEFLSSSSNRPLNNTEKVEALSAAITDEQCGVGQEGSLFLCDPYETEEEFTHHNLDEQSTATQMNHKGLLFHPLDSYLTNINPRINFMAPETMICHDAPIHHQFLMIHPSYLQPNYGLLGFDDHVEQPMLWQMQMPGNLPQHAPHRFPHCGELPLPPSNNLAVARDYNPMQGFQFGEWKSYFNDFGNPVAGPEVDGSSNPPEALQRIFEMERMAKPSMLIAQQLPPMVPDLSSPDRSLHRRGSSSSSGRRDLVFVVNPRGANGRTGKEWKKLLPYLRSSLGNEYNICESFTSGPCHAIDITREAIREGADAVIAVGGDGTLHEVVNGFFWCGKLVSNQDQAAAHTTALGLIPLGTGSDFARTFHWKNNPYEAVDRIAKGQRSWIDVGAITGGSGEPHYFINVADIHLSAKAGYYAAKYKRFGKLCYVIGALQAFMGHHNQDLRVKIDDGEWETYSQVTALCIGNGKYFGGGMKISPNAEPSSGNFEVVVLQDFKWYDFILKLHRLYNGTHLSVKNVTSRRARSIEVEEIAGCGTIYVQSDGEYLGFLPRKYCILPRAIQMLT
ncbi:hypothetical protein Nepgr_019112 [Nepenthes gracilis]|uniref:DAGKc domain-containing protein n=1 Tax=Nepenthes gracilis TaxID=150966 RepID=A0AAD3SWD4_NEPGR|nr:hypothetical protein Nepgr_019112 [Nepenthes gracilis]